MRTPTLSFFNKTKKYFKKKFHAGADATKPSNSSRPSSKRRSSKRSSSRRSSSKRSSSKRRSSNASDIGESSDRGGLEFLYRRGRSVSKERPSSITKKSTQFSQPTRFSRRGAERQPNTHKNYVALIFKSPTDYSFTINTRLLWQMEYFVKQWKLTKVPGRPEHLASYAQSGNQNNTLFLSLLPIIKPRWHQWPAQLDPFNHIHIFKMKISSHPLGIFFSYKDKYTKLETENNFLSFYQFPHWNIPNNFRGEFPRYNIRNDFPNYNMSNWINFFSLKLYQNRLHSVAVGTYRDAPPPHAITRWR